MRQMPRLITPRSAPRIAGMVAIAPAPDLADVVEQHWVVAWDHRGIEPVVQEVLPDPCVNLAVEPAGVLLYGVTSRSSRHVLAGAGSVLGTKFRPGGFSGYVDGPVRALRDRVLGMDQAFGAGGSAFERELAGAADTVAMVEIVTAFLRSRRPPPDPQRALVGAVVEAMRDAPPGTSVADVARRFAVAPRTLQRMFAAHVGATPKRVLQRFRHQDAVDRLSAPEAGGLARLAAELGYFDQAHFTQDFRAATGRVPSSA
jgi:AraC-like DNA-binding protein